MNCADSNDIWKRGEYEKGSEITTLSRYACKFWAYPIHVHNSTANLQN